MVGDSMERGIYFMEGEEGQYDIKVQDLPNKGVDAYCSTNDIWGRDKRRGRGIWDGEAGE